MTFQYRFGTSIFPTVAPLYLRCKTWSLISCRCIDLELCEPLPILLPVLRVSLDLIQELGSYSFNSIYLSISDPNLPVE